MSHDSKTPRQADFSERVLALAVDYALFAGLWALLLKAIDPSVPLLENPKGSLLSVALTGFFLLYQAVFSSEGRASLGKRLVGLRVVDGEGEPLSLGAALFRAACYVPSSIMSLGFFWALVDPHGRGWHDLAVGSRVVGLRPASGFAPQRLAAGVLVTTFALAWGWTGIWEERYLKLMTVSYARAGMSEIQQLQKAYKAKHGRYAESLFSLATASIDPRGFLHDASALYELSTFRFKADRNSYTIVARARDVDGTLVAVSGP
jgi:uncharacterized RDD family membrane protein YckC